MKCLRITILLALAFSFTVAHATVTVQATAGPQVLEGDSPALTITGLEPGARVILHAFRLSTVYPSKTDKGGPTIAHAQATFQADSHGTVNIDTAIPLTGTYATADPLGLLWSGTPLTLTGTPGQPITQNLALLNESEVVFRLEVPTLTPKPWIETRIHLTDGADLLDIQPVAAPGLNGAFARPKAPSSKPLPSILILHGSEGGSAASARASAIRFAHLGYAALAVNYFAWPYSHVEGVPHAFIDIPVETLATARAWLARQPNVDTSKVALWGVSKGAEFALLAASHYDWIDRVVACVPSAVVWSGFGRPPAPGEVYSSWSIAGTGLPYIPYDNYQDVLDFKFSAAYVHRRSLLAATPAQRAAARIPIEQTHARLLLIASNNDVVWPSGDMTRSIERTLADAHKSSIAQALIFENASHYICGNGSETRRINPVHKPEGNDPTPEADAQAAATGWQATKAFLAPR